MTDHDDDDVDELIAVLDFTFEIAIGWRGRALCIGMDPDAFFPRRGDSTREARSVCARCPVVVQCSEFAIASNERFGVWGATTERQRAAIRRERKHAEKIAKAKAQDQDTNTVVEKSRARR